MLPLIDPGARDRTLDRLLRDVVEELAPLDRTPCSIGERHAAVLLAERLSAAAGAEAALEEEPSWGTFPPTATALGTLGIFAAGLVLRHRRVAGAALATLAFAGIVDEAQNGPRVIRRLIRRRRSTVNVVATIPPATASPGTAAPPVDTLVVLAHHDAPQTGILFDQSLLRLIWRRAPRLLERAKTSPPQWWLGLAGPLLTVIGAASRSDGLPTAGAALGALGVSLVVDVWRSATVEGANDNLSGVAVLVGLGALLRERPLAGLEVMLVSCGAEETLQDGVRAFLRRHGPRLAPGRTCFVNVDTVGSPHLAMLEGEGPVWMEDYAGPWLRDLVEDCAARGGIALERGFRARASTDSVIPSRAGYATATIVSVTDWRVPANYHLPSDVPANLEPASVREATHLVLEVARSLAGERARAPEGNGPVRA